MMTDVKMAFSLMRFDHKPQPGDPALGALTSGFINAQVSLTKAAEYILSGHPYTVWLKEAEDGSTYRKTENYLLGQHLALDFDNGKVTVESLQDDPLAARFSTLAYPTLSSTEENPRTRLLFCLDTPIHQAQNYRRAVEALMGVYGDTDPHCKSPAQFFFGAGNGSGAQAPWFNGRVLPLSKVREIIDGHEHRRASAPRAMRTQREPGSGTGLVRFWEERVSSAQKGSRNKILNDAAHAYGELIRDGVLNREDAVARLYYAATVCGLEGVEIERTIASGFKKWGV